MEITKIVITGGPCAGKSTAMGWVQKAFSQLGYTVLFVPETATELISGGVAPWTCGTNADYQSLQLQLQMEKERIFKAAASTMPKDKILIVCDRGALDNKAYMTEEDWVRVLQQLQLNEVEMRDGYDGYSISLRRQRARKNFTPFPTTRRARKRWSRLRR